MCLVVLISCMTVGFSTTLQASPTALRCDDISQVFDLFWKVSDQQRLRDNSSSLEFGKSLVNSFLNILDPMKLYFLDDHVEEIQSFFKGDTYISEDFIERVCPYIDRAAMLYKQQVSMIDSEMYGLLMNPLYKLGAKEQDSTINMRMQVDREFMPWAESSIDLKQRWQERLLFERYKLINYNYDDFLNMSEGFFSDHHRLMTSDNIIKQAFLKTIFKKISVDGKYYVFNKIPLLKVFAGIRYQYKMKSPFVLHVPISIPYLSSEFIEIRSNGYLKISLNVDDYINIKSSDKLVNFFDINQPNKELLYVLRKSNEYIFQKLLTIPLKFSRSAFFVRNVNFKQSISRRVPEDMKYVSKHDKSDIADISSVMYLYVRDMHVPLKRGSNSSISAVRSILGDIMRRNIESDHITSTSLVLDLRGSALLNLGKALALLEVFLPNTPVFQVIKTYGAAPLIVTTRDPELSFNGPVVVLVDQSTSYLSEMVAGVLQEYGRAVIVGEGLGMSTYGKSSFVGIKTMSDNEGGLGSLVTSQGWVYTIMGRSLVHKGVQPDFTLPKVRGNPNLDQHYYMYLQNKIPSLMGKDILPVVNISAHQNSKSLINILKERSHNRLLKRKYLDRYLVMDISLSSNKLRSRYVNFNKKFNIEDNDLLQERSRSCDSDYCKSVSLNFQKFSKSMSASDYRSEYLQKSFLYTTPDKLKRLSSFYDLITEDDYIVYEAMHIALDYERIMSKQALQVYSFYKKSN